MIDEEDIKEVKKLLSSFVDKTNSYYEVQACKYDVLNGSVSLTLGMKLSRIFNHLSHLKEYLDTLIQEYVQENCRQNIKPEDIDRYSSILKKHNEERKNLKQITGDNICTIRLMLDNHTFVYLGAVKYTDFTDEFLSSILEMVIALYVRGKEELGINVRYGNVFSSIKTCGDVSIRNKSVDTLRKEVTEYLTKLQTYCRSISYLGS